MKASLVISITGDVFLTLKEVVAVKSQLALQQQESDGPLLNLEGKFLYANNDLQKCQHLQSPPTRLYPGRLV
ncbi:hypothetical protein LOSG293_020110 [Secundilactobacillus oryzae JCM 18671]|uniref:Uncharacterized protein n=1 Tax=Secundilactobacillus oryzae JCM 18671 TaxID=1291743 RepID=A0A081BGA5_9LACO|nr:hypothetical protein LOSG293_020110 [Secundilactobacillus oryzae JCM 18671]